MNLAPPNSAIVANTNLSDNHTAATVVRQKEWWTTHPTGQDDVLEIATTSPSRGDQPPVDALAKVTSNGVIVGRSGPAQAVHGPTPPSRSTRIRST